MKRLTIWMLVILGIYVVTAPIWPSVTSFKQNDRWDFSIPSIDLYSSFNDIVILDSSQDPGFGNTVITGHRFLYRSPYVPSLYHLDSVSIGDLIEIAQGEVFFTYVVDDVFEVEAGEVWVEEAVKVPVVTVYTCTPLWQPTHRLVVRGKLVRVRR